MPGSSALLPQMSCNVITTAASLVLGPTDTRETPVKKTRILETPELPAAVAGFVPAKRHYVPREISSGWTDADLLDDVWESNQVDGYCARCGERMNMGDKCSDCGAKALFRQHSKVNIAITGPTGTGKTSGLVDFAHRHQLPLFTISMMTSAHAAFGQFVPDADTGGLRWLKGPAWMIAEHGGVLYFDEMNFLEPSVQAAFFGLIDFRRTLVLMEHPIKAHCQPHGPLEHLVDPITGQDHRQCPGIAPWDGPYSVRLNPKTLVAASYNPVSGEYAGTGQLNAAMANRFTVLRYPYSPEVEADLISCPSIRALGMALRNDVQRIRTPVSTNSLMEFERWIFETNDYLLARTLFLGRFTPAEQTVIRQILEDQFERNHRQPDKGIFGFFGITAQEDELVVDQEEEA